MPLSSKSFGLAGGILVSLTLFGISWHAILTDLGNEFVKIWEDMPLANHFLLCHTLSVF